MTAPAMDAEQASKITDRLYAKILKRRPEIERFEAYHRGDQPLAYASREWSKEHKARYKDFSDNWCGIVGSAAAERTELLGFRIDHGDDPLDDAGRKALSDVERLLWRDWGRNNMPVQSAQGFEKAGIARRSAVIVWGDRDDNPVCTWESPADVLVDYEPGTRTGRYAIKVWRDDDLEHATLYTPSLVWKWQRRALAAQTVGGVTPSGLHVVGSMQPAGNGGWVPREGTGDDVWPLPNPLGKLPVLEFEHKPQLGGAEPLSRIAGTVSMQDAINLLWAYLFVAADHASMPARVVLGQEPPKIPILDANGQKIGEQPVDGEALRRGRMLWLTGEHAKIDSWQAASLDVFTKVINVAVKHVASQTKTPVHYIVGDLGNVNGETLTATETPLVTDVQNDHLAYGAPMRGVFELMALVRGHSGVAEGCRTGRPLWANAATRAESQLADAALKDKSIGFPLEWIAARRYGLGPDEVAELMEMVGRDPGGAGVLARVLRPGATSTSEPLAGDDDGDDPALLD